MISYKAAKKILIKSNIKIKKETINSLKSLNRVCAKDVYSPVNYPAGNNTAFDGYAVNSKDTASLNNAAAFCLFGINYCRCSKSC